MKKLTYLSAVEALAPVWNEFARGSMTRPGARCYEHDLRVREEKEVVSTAHQKSTIS